MDLVDEVVEKGTSRASCGLDTNIQAEQEEKERLRRAERKMECLDRNLEALWTVMEAGVPGCGSFQEPHLGMMGHIGINNYLKQNSG